jgi:hypothetical protein
MQLAQMSLVFPLKIPKNSSKYLLPSSFSTGKEEFSSDYSLLVIINFLLFGIKEKITGSSYKSFEKLIFEKLICYYLGKGGSSFASWRFLFAYCVLLH